MHFWLLLLQLKKIIHHLGILTPDLVMFGIVVVEQAARRHPAKSKQALEHFLLGCPTCEDLHRLLQKCLDNHEIRYVLFLIPKAEEWGGGD
jgi:hypothetical protein